MPSATEETEHARAEAVRRFHQPESTPTEDFGAIMRLAAMICDTQGVVISLVGTHQWWVRSSIGVEAASNERAAAFCTRVVASGRPLVVTDALAHEETALFSRSYRPPSRFYAGVPLVTEDGFVVGALAVVDSAPRGIDERQITALVDLARQVITQMELRRQTDALAETVRQLQTAEQSILHIADHDSLTGLPGRALFDDRLEQALRHATRYDETVAVMFLDLDGFKSVNDTHGHAAGDRLLQAVGNALRDTVRRSDTVARIGGDEFALVCPDIHDPDNASIVAEKLLNAVRGSRIAESTPVTASIGISVYPYDGANAETLLADADTAMYRAKRRGKNTFAFSAMVGRKG